MISGRTEIITWVVSSVALCALVTDVLKGKIFNWLTLPALALGLVVSFALSGTDGLLDGAAGALLGLLLFGWMFRIGVMGGGDVKLLMALGTWGGSVFVVETALMSIFLGGILAAALLLIRGKARDFVARVKTFLLSLALKDSKKYPFEMDRGNTMPFGIAIACAAVWIAVESPFVHWGQWPWR